MLRCEVREPNFDRSLSACFDFVIRCRCCYAADLRQAIERNVTIEIEVREEVSNEMAERMRDTESRMRDMFAKSAEVIVLLYN